MSDSDTTHDLRKKILEEAIGIVYAEGTEKITMRALGEKLGYSPATIYLHFRNKEELLQEIARFGLERLAGRCLPALHSEDPIAGLRRSAREYLAFAAENPALYRLVFGPLPPARNDPAAFPHAFAMLEARARLIEEGVRQGLLRGDDSELLATLHTAALHGFADLAISGRIPLPRSERGVEALAGLFADHLVDALLAGG